MVAYAVLSASSRFATPKTNVETDLALFLSLTARQTDLALFLSLTARCVRVAPPGALDSVGEAIARRLALPESTSRRTQLRCNGRTADASCAHIQVGWRNRDVDARNGHRRPRVAQAPRMVARAQLLPPQQPAQHAARRLAWPLTF
jgi:hypothetical protein